jgi:alanyl-tRNA synthetase
VQTGHQVRSAFLKYFAERGHRIVRSSSLVPESDPTLLFANAGMNQFKDVFLGRERRDYTRAASSQKCVRAGGKHNDLENVGRTARHHTFFEMLGNFSFGDYFKQDAIAFAWEFLTRDMRLDKDRLTVTIFKGAEGVPRDAEAFGFWKQHVKAERILELGLKDNFWSMGETGPCGPCSEVHFYQGDTLPCPEEQGGGRCRGVECECDRWLEIWNLVFMQFDRSSAGELAPLPAPCIDTGMGLERISAVVQGKLSNYDSDLFSPLLAAVSERAGKRYGADAEEDVSLRVIADHLRATAFLVADGVIPGNEGRGYVLRKIMRRALRHGKRLGIDDPFLAPLTAEVLALMSGPYPDLVAQAESIRRIVGVEEERFGATLKQALNVFAAVLERTPSGGPIAGSDAFLLYDTYGLALDFVEELASERRLTIDTAGFERELAAQRQRARDASKLAGVTGDPVFQKLLDQGPTQFVGYAGVTLDEVKLVAVLKGDKLVARLTAGEDGGIILERTPFYAAAGGQVGDRGILAANGSTAEVRDCTLPVPGLHLHQVHVTSGAFEAGMVVRAAVDGLHRAGAMRHHTATHLLHAALRETLGLHVKQAGSLVTPNRLRFDFSHYAALTGAELRQIEGRVNEQILRDETVATTVMTRDEALSSGALAFFGDKYGERVRVVEVPGFSKEFCGGTHVGRTGQIGLVLVTAEQGISAGTRRIEALAGEAAQARAQADEALLDGLERSAKAERGALLAEYARLRDQLKGAQREIERLRLEAATGGGAGAPTGDRKDVNGVTIWTPHFVGLDKKSHAAVVDDFRNRHRDQPFVLLSAASSDDGVHVISAVSEGLTERLKAPEIMQRLGLRGGGRASFAQGGGVAPAQVGELRTRASALLDELVQGSRP